MGIFDWFKSKESSEEVHQMHYDNGQLEQEGTYKDGKPHGLAKGYYETGVQHWEADYKYGERNGVEKRWHENGQLEQEATYKDDDFDGLLKLYYENGQLKGEENYKDGKKNGVDKRWYENGQLKQDGPFKDDKLHGLVKEYYENGQLSKEGSYVDGEFEGLIKEYYETGQLKGEYNFKHGKAQGEQRKFYEDGKLKQLSICKLDIVIKEENYDKKGKLEENGIDISSESEKKSEKETIQEYEKLTGKKVAVQDYQIEYEKMASDFDQLMSKHRSWHDIIVQRSDTMKDLAQSLHQSLEEITAEWTQSHFEEYKSKGGNIKEAKESIILRLEAYGHIYTCNQDFLKKVKSLISKYADRDLKYIEGFMESTLKWDIASAQASLMGSILFAQSLGMEDVEIMKYASIESFPEYVPGKTHEETMDDIERKHGLRD